MVSRRLPSGFRTRVAALAQDPQRLVAVSKASGAPATYRLSPASMRSTTC